MKRVQTAQHAFAAVTLAMAGWQHLHHGRGVLPVLEIAAAAFLIVVAARELRRRAHGHDVVGWVEIAGGFMTLVEAVAKTREPHHLSFLILGFVQPAVLFLFGIFDAQLAASRYLEANETHFIVRLRPFFRRSLRWQHARGFRFRGKRLEVDTERRVRGFSLRHVVDFDGAKAWTIEQFRRREIRELPAEELPGSNG